MKDERAVKTVRFHLFQMHADTEGGGDVFTLNKGGWCVGKSLSFPRAYHMKRHNLQSLA